MVLHSVVHMKKDGSSCVKNCEEKAFFSTVMKEILSEFGLQGVSHRSAAAVQTCVSVPCVGMCL